MANEMEELIGFLSSPSPQVKKVAVDIVRGLTGSEDGLQSLASYSKTVLPSLSHLLGEKKEVSEAATEALVNLSQNSDLTAKMIELGIIKATMDILYKQGCEITGLLVMLLVNLTQLDAGVESLLQLGDDKVQGLNVMKLVRSFCTSSNEKKDDPFGHVGSILVNISKNKAGRSLLLDPKRGLLKQIVRQFDSTSTLRKKGVCGTIRNCCFEADNQLQNLLLISEFLWPALLLPVAGNKGISKLGTNLEKLRIWSLWYAFITCLVPQPLNSAYFAGTNFANIFNQRDQFCNFSSTTGTKVYTEQDTSKMPLELGSALSIEREPVTDTEIRVQALEAIYLIVLQGAGRRAFWSLNGPRILQIGYEEEEDPKVMRAYEQIGSLLVEGNETEEGSMHTSS